ncbi:MAG: universal stress protein [Bacteroidales bacterium]|nr:universal stress protein [Bacteroidales bacterium]
MKNILVGIDFSNSAMTAMRHAVAMALKSESTLHLVWVKTPGAEKNIEENSNYLADVQAKLNTWVELCREESPKTPVNSIILEGKVHNAITEYAKNLPESIIVMGAHGTSGFEEGYIGNNAYRLINSSDVPVLIMRENIQINRDLHKIFVPIDTSFETLQKIKYAVQLAKMFAAQIVLYGVYYPNTPDVRHIINVQLRHAEDMCEEGNVRYVIETEHINHNDVCNTILESAKNYDANLIVIMREENETDFTASRNMRQILSTCSMPLYIIPNVNAYTVSR